MAINGNANGIPFLKSNIIPPAIRNSMILWYDLKKQGATNETMSVNPILKDLSGNGHDARCYNFAWSGMSGVGGYATDYTDYYQYTDKGSIVVTPTKIIIEKVITADALIETIKNIGEIPSYRIRVSGIPEGTTLRYGYYQEEGIKSQFDITEDGEYILPANISNNYKYVGFKVVGFTGDCNITIEQIPLYPGALVSDGVDDYCLVEGLPLLNKEDGYTVIAKRTWIGDVNSKSQGFVSKGSSAQWVDGAFYFECVEGSGTSLFNRVFPNSNSKDGVNRISSFAQENLTYLTSAKYNNSDIVNVGDGIDTDKLAVFKLATSSSSYYASISLYSLLLFNRDLSTDEIEWVKTNLIEK